MKTEKGSITLNGKTYEATKIGYNSHNYQTDSINLIFSSEDIIFKKDANLLPQEYQPVEYIESTGTQYIDTGCNGNQNTRVVINCDFNRPSSSKGIFGGRNLASANMTRAFCLYGLTNEFRPHYNNENTTGCFIFDNITSIDANKNVWKINNEIYTFNTGTFTTTSTLLLFTCRTNNGIEVDTRMSSGKISLCKIYDNNTLVRHFIPCYRKSDDVVGMYDIVNNQFYTNSGTGSFNKGPNVTISTFTATKVYGVEESNLICSNNLLCSNNAII